MKRRSWAVFGALMLLLAAAAGSIARVAGGAEYVAAAQQQSEYELTVTTGRGMIYDCNLQPMLGGEEHRTAAIAPTVEAIGAIETATDGQYRTLLASALESGKPFAMELEQEVEHPCITTFSTTDRYSDNQIAPHLIGYCDSTGAGASGIELAMNDVLEEYAGSITLYYAVDALGHVVAGEEPVVQDTLTDRAGGVALTIDSDLQRVTEQAAASLKKGAVVVTEAPNCEIRAMASVPTFSQNDLQAAVTETDSPLLNRALCGYAPGSVFKMVGAAAALESGLSSVHHTCTGEIEVDGLPFHCIDGTAHGSHNLRGAFMCSCNCYFIQCVGSLGGQSVLNVAYNLGLGASQEFGRGLFSSAGVLPTAGSLQNERALANFSFGQGELSVTPLQMCGLLNAVVSSGVYSTPKLILGTVTDNQELREQHAVTEQTVQAISKETANTLKSYLQSTMTGGTAKAGQPQGLTAGAKTGTAQTGVFSGGEELLHFWYCGYVETPAGKTYCITVLAESTPDDHGAAAKVFQTIAEYLGTTN